MYNVDVAIYRQDEIDGLIRPAQDRVRGHDDPRGVIRLVHVDGVHYDAVYEAHDRADINGILYDGVVREEWDRWIIGPRRSRSSSDTSTEVGGGKLICLILSSFFTMQ